MEVKIFDTHVRTRDGRYLHFDVLVTEELGARAGEFARRWLAGRGIDEADISQGHCSYCHSEIATAEVAEAIRLHGHSSFPGRLLRPMDSYHPIACDLRLPGDRLPLPLPVAPRTRGWCSLRSRGAHDAYPGRSARRRQEEYLRWPSKERLCCCAWIACWRLPPHGSGLVRPHTPEEEACSRASGMPPSHLGN